MKLTQFESALVQFQKINNRMPVAVYLGVKEVQGLRSHIEYKEFHMNDVITNDILVHRVLTLSHFQLV